MVKKKVSWKDKKLYTLLAPEIFNSEEVGTTVSGDSKSLVGRTVKLSLSNLTGDKARQPVKISLEVVSVEGNKAKTKFKSLSLDSRYIKSKIKKGVDKIECMHHLTFPNSKAWIKVIVITHQNIQAAKTESISRKVAKILKSQEKSKLNDFLQTVLFGKLGREIYREVKKIVPIRRVEVERVKVL